MFSAPLVSPPVLGRSVCPIFFLFIESLGRLRGSAEIYSQVNRFTLLEARILSGAPSETLFSSNFKISLCFSYVYAVCCMFFMSYESTGAHLELECGCNGKTLSGNGIIDQVDPHSNSALTPSRLGLKGICDC